MTKRPDSKFAASTTNNSSKTDLQARAHEEMEKAGFIPDFEPAVVKEVASLPPEVRAQNNGAKDLRSLLWSSIDNPDSKDLDQLEYAEKLSDGNSRLMVAIADVDLFVKEGSAIDGHASNNTTSVYTGIVTYPMLPDELSFDLTSLIAGHDRRAIVIDLIIAQNGSTKQSTTYEAIVRNKAKLDYITIGGWLEKGGDAPEKVNNVPGLAEQLLLQSDIKTRIHNNRIEQGALYLHTIEATPVISNDQILDLEVIEDNPARDLIENIMIAGNVSVSRFLEEKKFPSIRRIVKEPERWSRIVEVAKSYGANLPSKPDVKALAKFLLERKQAAPDVFPDLSLTIVKLLGRGEYAVDIPGQKDEGHFALAVHKYTHATAPNRRYPDLIMQRLIKAALAGKPAPYSVDELNKIAAHCTEQEDAANKVERTMRKVAAAVLLSKHIGEIFQGIITGVTGGGTFIRLFKPPAEGKIIQGEEGLDVGDKVKVRLISTDPEKAYIDFAYDKNQQ